MKAGEALVVSGHSISAELSHMSDSPAASRSRMFGTNEEEVTTHKHERKIFVHTTNSHAARRSDGVQKATRAKIWCGLGQIPYSFLAVYLWVDGISEVHDTGFDA
jgi:hypothetical protein